MTAMPGLARLVPMTLMVLVAPLLKRECLVLVILMALSMPWRW